MTAKETPVEAPAPVQAVGAPGDAGAVLPAGGPTADPPIGPPSGGSVGGVTQPIGAEVPATLPPVPSVPLSPDGPR